MVHSGALLFLLAVAAAVDAIQALSSVGSGVIDISECPISFYGQKCSFVHISFNGPAAELCFKKNSTENPRDCLVIEDLLEADRLDVETSNTTTYTNSSVHRVLTDIKSTSNCLVSISVYNQSTAFMFLDVYNFGTQTALKVRGSQNFSSFFTSPDLVLNARVGNMTVGSGTFSQAQLNISAYMDLSGCRLSDTPFAVNSSFSLLRPESCSRLICGSSGVLSPVSTCGPLEVCGRNSTCRWTLVCTVSGSTIIDFFGRNVSVPDRCVYRLTNPQGRSGFELLAGFRERRRRDVTFLDHLILSLSNSGVKIYLEQGGRVRVDDRLLILNATSQLVHGVSLSKDATGVTAEIQLADATVFFDGYTAHVVVTRGPNYGQTSGPAGLCGSYTNSSRTSTLSAEKSSNHSPAGCETQHQDDTSGTIDCSGATKHCNLLRQPPFTSCHGVSDPAPFVSTCTDTLCSYPSVDGLRCQFLEAFAKSCSLKRNITLSGWRLAAGCPAVPQAFCQDRFCSVHEFCGEKQHGGTRCFCRAIFASKYKRNNTLGEPTVCTQSSASLSLARCLLEDKGIDFSVLHLKDKNCRGRLDETTHMVTFSFNSSNTCGTDVTMTNSSQVMYQNTIMTRNSSLYSIITRHDQVEIDFSCVYAQPEVKTLAFLIKDGSVVQQIVSGVWNYTLMMNAYTDPDRSELVGPTTEIRLNQKVWLELKTTGLDDRRVAVVTDSCWATNEPSPAGRLRYDLIRNKCPNPADETVKVETNGRGTSSFFSFNMFEFSGKNSEVYLHCRLELCIPQGNNCVPTCSGRSRRFARSKSATENSALITMAWGNEVIPN